MRASPRTVRDRRWAAALTAAAATLWAPGAAAQPTCEEVRVQGAPHLTVSDTYSPFAPADLTELVSLTIVNTGDEPCALALAFTAPNGGRLRNAGQILSYTLETAGGAPLLNPPNLPDPEAGNHVTMTLGAGQASSIGVRTRIFAGQMAAPGSYTDNAAELHLYHMPDDGFSARVRTTAFPVTVEVAAVCRLTPPRPAALDLTEDIDPDARPQGAWHNVRLRDAACNTASRLKLTAPALTRDGGTAPAGFDDFIDFEAVARFQSVMATLLTDGADAPAQAHSPQAGPDGASNSVAVQIRLRPGQPLAPGAYESTLTISLEPSS